MTINAPEKNFKKGRTPLRKQNRVLFLPTLTDFI